MLGGPVLPCVVDYHALYNVGHLKFQLQKSRIHYHECIRKDSHKLYINRHLCLCFRQGRGTVLKTRKQQHPRHIFFPKANINIWTLCFWGNHQSCYCMLGWNIAQIQLSKRMTVFMCVRPQSGSSNAASEVYRRRGRASPYSGKGHHPALWWALNTGRVSTSTHVLSQTHTYIHTYMHTCCRASS